MSTRYLSPVVNKLSYLAVIVLILWPGASQLSLALFPPVLLPFGDIWTERKVFAMVAKNNDKKITGQWINDSTLGKAWYAERISGIQSA